MTQTNTEKCPCGSDKTYPQCCELIHLKKKSAQTAEDLLRARYSAFVKGKIDFILDTHHGKTKKEVNIKEIQEWSTQSAWKGLEIVQKEAGDPEDSQGLITFCARYQSTSSDTAPDKIEEHWENALFEKEDGEWKFLDARAVKQEPIRRAEPKTGRNEPCPCGSGKKHKKCCG